SFAGRCRQFRCAQILWTERRGLPFSTERLVNPADYVRWRARERATPRHGERRGDCGNGDGGRMDIARSRRKTAARSEIARRTLDADFEKRSRRKAKRHECATVGNHM